MCSVYLSWLGIHAWLLSGFRTRVQALGAWSWNYFGHTRAAAYINRPERDPTSTGTTSRRHLDRRSTDHRRSTMSTPIEDYAIIGDTRTVAAVAAQRLDRLVVRAADRLGRGASPRCSANREHGRWLHRAEGRGHATIRRRTPAIRSCSRPSSRRADGTVKVIDFMSPGVDHPTIFRHRRGRVGLGADAPRAHRPLRLRLDRTVGAVDRRRAHARRGQRRAPVPQPGAAPGRRPDHRRPSSRSARVTDAASRWRGTRRSRTRRRRSTRRPRCGAPSSTGRSGSSGAPTTASGATTSCARSSP